MFVSKTYNILVLVCKSANREMMKAFISIRISIFISRTARHKSLNTQCSKLKMLSDIKTQTGMLLFRNKFLYTSTQL